MRIQKIRVYFLCMHLISIMKPLLFIQMALNCQNDNICKTDLLFLNQIKYHYFKLIKEKKFIEKLIKNTTVYTSYNT